MYSSMWFMSICALLVVDVRTGALQQDTQPRRCHQCSPTNSSSCQHSEAGWLTATCPSARPYCATVAVGPDFASSLGCAAVAAPCSLTNSPTQTLELTCVCEGQLCNAPYSIQLRHELLNFSSPGTNESALTEAFLKLSDFANVSVSALYRAITVSGNSSHDVTTDESLSEVPRVEALKQQTVPSEDDEDESEGSGAYEEPRLRTQGQSASAPAAPSSYLPSEENQACALATALILPVAFIFFIV